MQLVSRLPLLTWSVCRLTRLFSPFNKVELTGAKDLGGQIQVLQYKGDHLSLGYWYNWIQ